MVGKKRGLVLILLTLVLLVFTAIPVSAAKGCYNYVGGDETLHCLPGIDSVEAKNDCDNFDDCNIDVNFIEGSDCSDIDTCKEVICDVDCDSHSEAWCKQLGLNTGYKEGVEVIDFNAQCSLGCCRVQRDDFSSCNFGTNEYECNLRSFRAGVSIADRIFDNSPRMNQLTCQQNICLANVPKIHLFGKIKNSDGIILSNDVNIKVTSDGGINQGGKDATYDSTTGKYNFPELTIGTHTIKVSALGYNTKTFSIELPQDKTEVERDVVLTKSAGTGTIIGKVRDKNNFLRDVLVSFGDKFGQQVRTDTNGEFTITHPAGGYKLKLSKVGYVNQEVSIEIVEDSSENLEDIVLIEQAFQGIQGVTTVGFDDGDQEISAVKIFINGVFRGFSGEKGQYKISLPQGDHEVTATFETDKTFEAGPITITIRKDEVLDLPLFLEAPAGECDIEPKPVEEEKFLVRAIPGKKDISIKWAKPCREVIGFRLIKIYQGNQIKSKDFPVSQRFFIDNENLEWGETYSYEIRALYDQNRVSSEVAQAITLGDEVCGGKYDKDLDKWAKFCDVSRAKEVLTCNYENRLVQNKDCSEKDVEGQHDFYCARVSPTEADCKDAGICLALESKPFGLYHTEEMCYGTISPENGNANNFCYYDFSTKTITNACNSCLDSEGVPINCFDYKSKIACQINNCAATACNWVDSASTETEELIDYSNIGLNIPGDVVTTETGTGYCVAEKYNGGKEDPENDDYCSLCGPNAKGGIFENYFCTADVCTNLGRCLSNPPSQGEVLSSCLACGELPTEEISCYSYQTELECNGGSPSENRKGEFVNSEDSCNWGRCRWDGGSCVKDGDASQDDDCVVFNGRERTQCITDINPPSTSISSETLISISTTESIITFTGNDEENVMGTLHYCLTSAESSGNCEPNKIVNYQGKANKENLEVNLIEIPEIANREIKGESFLLRYYSKDKYYNQENLQEILVFIDNVEPSFEIVDEIIPKGDLTDLNVRLQGLREPARCDFVLKKEIPTGGVNEKMVGREVRVKTVSYESLDGISYSLNVTCKDDYGNIASKKKVYVFDLEENIDILYPPLQGAVAETSISFKANTAVGATCELYDKNNQIIIGFITDQNGKEHQTEKVSGFFEGKYSAEHKIVCKELLNPSEIFEEFFDFVVDFTPPKTQIVITEGSREVRPINYGWEEFFIKQANVNFECDADEGFACSKTLYCLGDDCDFKPLNEFLEYSESLKLIESTRICYYSTDEINNQVLQANCGTIIVDGYGITLEKPIAHFYKDEVWGVSSEPIFVLQFSTRVPTTECRIDFSSKFDYNQVPNHKIATPDGNGKYIFENFPDSVFTRFPGSGGVKKIFVQCKNVDEEIGPEQKFNLEYDPTPPKILNAFAKPKNVVEGISTELTVRTDDKTLCKYSDNSEGDGSEDYDTMEYSFPGTKKRILGEEHKDTFKIDFIGDKKEYHLNSQCVNGAGVKSEVEEIIFNVDYSALGNIISVFPDGHSFGVGEVESRVITNKNSVCEYSFNETYELFETNDGLTHTQLLTGLTEGEYLAKVRCFIEGETRHAQMKFFIDFTPPIISEVVDGNYSCGAPELSVFIYTNEKNISSHTYELFDRGETKSGFLSTGVLVLSGTTTGFNPIKISASNLTENRTYTVKVTATDEAGNVGDPKESNGIAITNKNHISCQNDKSAPLVQFIEDSESSCTSTIVQLKCSDSVACSSLKFGKGKSSTECSPTTPYGGSGISIEGAGWICYYVEDVLGNNHTAVKQISFHDEDGDGVSDNCDKCENTAPGKLPSKSGCAEGDVSKDGQKKDRDKDGLPDNWEETYNSPTCPLDPDAIDSDGDGELDNKEDYDGDGRSNFEEYIDGTHPCVADEKRAKGPTPRGGESPINENNLLAWIFLIVGILMMAGGIGYLVYYYKYSSKKKPAPLNSGNDWYSPKSSVVQKPMSKWKIRLLEGRKRRLEKSKVRTRKSLFGEFGKDSKIIPHISPSLNGGKVSPARVKRVAKSYVENKKKIKPGLKSSEKGIFDKLENLAGGKRTVTKSEAKDIFSKLRGISKKRKNE